MKIFIAVLTVLRIYCAEQANIAEKMMRECKNPIAIGDFNGFLHVTVQLG